MLKVLPITEILKASKEAEFTGNYQQGLETLSFFWDYKKPEIIPSFDDYQIEDYALLLKACGVLFGFWGSSSKNAQEISKNILTECRNIYVGLNNKIEALSCANYLALAYWRIGTLDEARIWLLDSIEILPENHIVRLHAFSIESLINISDHKYQEVIDRTLQLKPLIEQLNNEFITANFLACLGIAYKNIDDFPNALKNTQFALQIFHKIGHSRYVSYSGNNLACFYRAIGDMDQALIYVSKALNIAIKTGDLRQMGGIYDTHALICYDLKQFDIALYYAEKAVECLRKTDNYLYLIEYIETKIRILWSLERFGEAVLNCSEAIEIARRFTSTSDVNRLTNMMHHYIADKCMVKIFREGRAISVFENFILNMDEIKTNNPVYCIEIHSSRYISFGIEKGCLAVVEESDTLSGDFVAVRKKNSNHSFLGFIEFSSTDCFLRLNQDLADLKLSLNEFEIIGKIIGYCEEPVSGEIELKVKPLRIEK